MVGYKPVDGDRIILVEDVITAGTAVREVVPQIKACADAKITDMFISVNRCEVGANGEKTAVMEVKSSSHRCPCHRHRPGYPRIPQGGPEVRRCAHPYGGVHGSVLPVLIASDEKTGAGVLSFLSQNILKKRPPGMNCTPFVRQYVILNNKWGALLCQKEYRTRDILQNSKNCCRNHAEGKTEL